MMLLQQLNVINFTFFVCYLVWVCGFGIRAIVLSRAEMGHRNLAVLHQCHVFYFFQNQTIRHPYGNFHKEINHNQNQQTFFFFFMNPLYLAR